MIPSLLSALALASAPLFAQQTQDGGVATPPNLGVTSTGGTANGSAGCGTGTTTTHFLAGNGQAGNMFDIAVGASDMTIECLDIHVSSAAGTVHSVEVFAVPGTCVGKDTGDLCANGWVQIGTGSATSAGSGFPTNVVLTPTGSPYVFSAGATYGIYVTLIGSTSIRYTNGGPTVYTGTHCDITTQYGKASYTPPCTLGSTFQPREWNGTLYTAVTGPPVFTLAASGTCGSPMLFSTTNGTPNGRVVFLWGPTGSVVQNNPNLSCFGLTLDLDNPRRGFLFNDANGACSVQISTRSSHCGVILCQAVDVATCTKSGTVAL